MKTLTETQKQFLLNHFFKNEIYAGWKNIATTLLETGSCIVAGTNCIWVGGIGNFIKTNEASNLIDCVEYRFDLDYFLTSNYYKDIQEQYKYILFEKKRQIEKEYDDIRNLN